MLHTLIPRVSMVLPPLRGGRALTPDLPFSVQSPPTPTDTLYFGRRKPKESIPNFTLLDYAEYSGLKRRWGQARLGWEVGKLFWHLPDISKKRILKYLISPSLVKDLFNRRNPGQVTRKFISYAGIPFAKQAQRIAQLASQQSSAEMERRSQALSRQIETLEKQKKKLGKKPEAEPLALQISGLKRQLMMGKIDRWARNVFGPMLDNAPALSQKELQPELENLIRLVNQGQKKGSRLLVKSIGRKNRNMIGSASVAQVYRGEMEDGRKAILKVLRPDANQQYIDQFEMLVARFNMLLFGASDDMRALSRKWAKNTSDVLRQEINPNVEAESAKRMRRVVEERKIDLHIPQIYAHTSRGLVEECVEGETFNSKAVPEDVWKKGMKEAQLQLMRLMQSNPVLHADLTAGNAIVKWNQAHEIEYVGLIDFGRVTAFEPDSYAKVADLMEAVLLNQPQAQQLMKLEAFFNKPEEVSAERKARILGALKQHPMNGLKLLTQEDDLRTLMTRLQNREPDGLPVGLKPFKGHNVQPGTVTEALRKFELFRGEPLAMTGDEKYSLSAQMADDLLFYSHQSKGLPIDAAQKRHLTAAIEKTL